MPSVQVPLLCHAAAGGEGAAFQLATACLLIYLGCDLLDNVLDDELPEVWLERGEHQATLAATTILSALPTLALAESEATPELLGAMAQATGQALAAMSAGQFADMDFPRRERVSLEECREMSERKAGAQVGLFARLGAILAGADEEQVAAYEAFGTYLGTAANLASDVADIWSDGPSRDLLAGKQTLPIVHARRRLTGADLDSFEELLRHARRSATSQAAVRDALERTGSFRYAAFMIGLYRQRAVRALQEAEPAEPAGADLRAYLDRVLP